MSTQSYVVAVKNPRRKWLGFALILILLVLTAMLSRYDSLAQLQRNSGVISQLSSDLAKVKQRAIEQAEAIVDFKRNIEVLKQSESITATENKSLQQRIYELEKDLSLYKRVMGKNAQTSSQVKVAGFDLQPLTEKGRFHYEITMVQMAQKHGWVSGELTGTISGLNAEGKKQQLNWENLVDARGKSVRFRYYQELKGEMTLPEGFTAESINFSLKLKGRQVAIKQHFLWPLAKETMVNVQIQRENQRT